MIYTFMKVYLLNKYKTLATILKQFFYFFSNCYRCTHGCIEVIFVLEIEKFVFNFKFITVRVILTHTYVLLLSTKSF